MRQDTKHVKRTDSLRLQRMHIPSHILMIIWCLVVLVPVYLLFPTR